MMKIKKNHLTNTIIQFNTGNRNNVNPCQVKMLTVTGRKFYQGLKRMAQQLRRLAVLVEALCSVTGTTWYLMTFWNSSPRASNTLSHLHWHCMHMTHEHTRYMHIQAGKVLLHVKYIIKRIFTSYGRKMNESRRPSTRDTRGLFSLLP